MAFPVKLISIAGSTLLLAHLPRVSREKAYLIISGEYFDSAVRNIRKRNMTTLSCKNMAFYAQHITCFCYYLLEETLYGT